MYPALARATKGRFHVKTAGTSYLEALRVVAIHDEALFRRVIDFARDHYEADKATYHVSATLRSAAPASEIFDRPWSWSATTSNGGPRSRRGRGSPAPAARSSIAPSARP